MSVQLKIVKNSAFPEIESCLIERLISEPDRMKQRSEQMNHSKKATGVMRIGSNIAGWLTVGFGAQAA